MSRVQISVIICSRNRAQDLREAMESVWNQELESPASYELVVVDNASTDHTREVVEGRAMRSPIPTKYVYEPKVGLSTARNTGARAASGEILAYLDDDAIASPHWLKALGNAFEKYPEAWVAGGPLKLKWLVMRPAWLGQDLDCWLGALDLGPTLRELGQEHHPYGGNFFCRKTAWDQVGGFLSDFTLYHDERYFCRRVRQLGKPIVYAPEAWAWHKVSKGRATRRYFFKRIYLQGYADLVWRVMENKQRVSFAWLIHSLYGIGVRLLKEIFKKRDVVRLRFWLEVSALLGELRASFQVFRQGGIGLREGES